MSSTSSALFIGVDVGTGSARAGIFDAAGKRRAVATEPIRTWKPQADFVEQSSADIWRAVCEVVRAAVTSAGVDAMQISGIGFDATCSLVALDADDKPVSVSPTDDDEQNIIVWMDHRALEQAQRINEIGHPVLKYVGNRISPEMQTPKLLWLKEHHRRAWKRAARFFDLPDFLTYRATGVDARSLCTTVCKWTYLGHEESDDLDTIGRWDPTYFEAIGLEELVEEDFARIGRRVRPMGEAIPGGLSKKAAAELGLLEGTAVGVGIIDAHAGGLGVLGAALGGKAPTTAEFEQRLALIGGTSSCHMAASRERKFIEGVWGPYFSAMIPGLWLTEGGQSATGALIDHIIFSHARAGELQEQAKEEGKTVYQLLNKRLSALAEQRAFRAELTQDLHVLPYFHGNRSPRADATLRGMVSGLGLSDTLDDLALLYLATIQAIAYGTRHIIEEMNRAGYNINTIFACGGGTKNPVFLREHADITGCRIVLPEEPEAVLLGSAILGATAARAFDSVPDAMAAMNSPGDVLEPAGGAVREYHDAKYGVFHRMCDDFLAYRRLMADSGVAAPAPA
jgi:FGGY-family pentulose kinase